jgi:hypothetical protein
VDAVLLLLDKKRSWEKQLSSVDKRKARV